MWFVKKNAKKFAH